MKKVVVGLSGGVDSAVTCFLLKKQGYDVTAVFMQNWDSFVNKENYDNQKDKCDAQYEWDDAQKIAKILDVPIHKIDFIKEYWDEVFVHFLEEYKAGRTPNPDVLCNRYIKFGHLLKYAKDKFECDYIATGHYAKVEHYNDHSELHMCKDTNKDQTYFLCGLNQSQLQMTLFPLSDLLKSEVREIARENNLEIWDKKDSTGICFIGERNFQDFLKNYIPNQPGKIIDIETNEIVGSHVGVMYYTIGQNNGLSLGGSKYKYFVCKKDVDKKILYVVRDSNKDKYLLSYECTITDFNWINKPTSNTNLKVRFRHRQTLTDCSIRLEDDKVVIIYPNGSNNVTEGQYGVIYEENNCIGGGVITSVKENS
ncbi:MAG: tRNA 2-thiouridine(34) synthase MnmA [Mycoplasma sp.]